MTVAGANLGEEGAAGAGIRSRRCGHGEDNEEGAGLSACRRSARGSRRENQAAAQHLGICMASTARHVAPKRGKAIYKCRRLCACRREGEISAACGRRRRVAHRKSDGVGTEAGMRRRGRCRAPASMSACAGACSARAALAQWRGLYARALTNWRAPAPEGEKAGGRRREEGESALLVVSPW